ncbi:MAG: Uma2 family endonuclease [Bacteroidota bacterium]
MGEAIKNNKYYSFKEYLELEKHSELRHEYFYGEVFALAGTTIKHNDIIFNAVSVLKNTLKGKNCKINFESVKVKIKAKEHYTYPDIVVSCDKNEDDPLTIKYPILIIEVLSDATRRYDRGKKFQIYKQIPDFKHYLLIEQDFCLVDCFTRKGDLWYHKSYTEESDTINLEHLDLNIPVKRIYENIEYDKEIKPSF